MDDMLPQSRSRDWHLLDSHKQERKWKEGEEKSMVNTSMLGTSVDTWGSSTLLESWREPGRYVRTVLLRKESRGGCSIFPLDPDPPQ